jgi:hypothetical protein
MPAIAQALGDDDITISRCPFRQFRKNAAIFKKHEQATFSISRQWIKARGRFRSRKRRC